MIERWILADKWPSNGLILPRIQAHRGYCLDGATENTVAAFEAAKRRGALMFECDVRLSNDRVPVLFHDEDLQRIGGTSDKVSDLTAQQLKAKVQAPTLEEVLKSPSVPRYLNIEMKTKNKLDDPLERKVAEVVKKCRAENRVLFSSFNPMSLYRVSLHLPNVPRALLVTSADDTENNFILRKMLLAPFLSFHCLNLDRDMVTEETMAFWKNKKIPVAVWTLKSKDDIAKYLSWGAMSVITDVL